MAVVEKTAEAILKFYPTDENGQHAGIQRVEIAKMDGGEVLAHRLVSFFRRRLDLEGEPCTPDSTTQPVLVIERGGKIVNKIIHRSDVEALGEARAEQVLEKIRWFEARRMGFVTSGAFAPGR